jgi:hypothetical protein
MLVVEPESAPLSSLTVAWTRHGYEQLALQMPWKIERTKMDFIYMARTAKSAEFPLLVLPFRVEKGIVIFMLYSRV